MKKQSLIIMGMLLAMVIVIPLSANAVTTTDYYIQEEFTDLDDWSIYRDNNANKITIKNGILQMHENIEDITYNSYINYEFQEHEEGDEVQIETSLRFLSEYNYDEGEFTQFSILDYSGGSYDSLLVRFHKQSTSGGEGVVCEVLECHGSGIKTNTINKLFPLDTMIDITITFYQESTQFIIDDGTTPYLLNLDYIHRDYITKIQYANVGWGWDVDNVYIYSEVTEEEPRVIDVTTSLNKSPAIYYTDEQVAISCEIELDKVGAMETFKLDYKLVGNETVFGEIQMDTDGKSTILLNTAGVDKLEVGSHEVVVWWDENNDETRNAIEPWDFVEFEVIEYPTIPSPEKGYPTEIDIEIDSSKYEINEEIEVRIFTNGYAEGTWKNDTKLDAKLMGGYTTGNSTVYTDENGTATVYFTVPKVATDVYVFIYADGGETATSEDFYIYKATTVIDEDDEKEIIIDEPEEDTVFDTYSWVMTITGAFAIASWFGVTGKVRQLKSLGVIKSEWFVKYGMYVGVVLIALAIVQYINPIL